jgi:DNA topoisomerase IB
MSAGSDAAWCSFGDAQDYIGGIRRAYEADWGSKSVQARQMAVALYFIDKLALRAGHEKDEDEADTVGCCTLKVPCPCLGFPSPL